MPSFNLTTPVVLLVFNRPDTTTQVFNAIRSIRPLNLLVVADGPRAGVPSDLLKCEEVRRIVEQVDWPCEVFSNYSESNLGCKVRVSSGLDWVFSMVEEAIILEDDCLPDQSFFRFCQDMLNLYRYDDRIMSICGSNLVGSWNDDLYSYHFSQCSGVWGWATWRRAWKLYDVNMSMWKDHVSRQKLFELLGDSALYRMRVLDFDRVSAGDIDTWDYQWSFAQLIRSALTVVSAVNLVSNIGFSADATHTISSNSPFAELPVFQCRFPLEINPVVSVDYSFDAVLVSKILSERPFLLKVSDSMRHFLRKLLVK